MSDRRHHLRLWILGTLVLMVTLGSLTGSLLRQWSDGIALPTALASADPLMTGSASLMVLILGTLWFRNGIQLWKAARV
jgi:hypothetical protein